jgi:hypothetical protein
MKVSNIRGFSPPPETPDQLDMHPWFWLSNGFPNRERSIPFLTLALPPVIRDKNRIR